MRMYFVAIILLVVTQSRAQKVETVYQKSGDSSANLYVVVHPPSLPLKGYLLLIPGMFQKAADVLVQTNLAKHAANQGLLTVVPTFSTGIASVGIDLTTQEDLRKLLQHLAAKFDLGRLPFYLGGFSIGGTCAIRYAELALSNDIDPKPVAVFAIDAPLDFERMYNNMLRETRLTGSGGDALAESNYMLNYFNRVFGGSPAQALGKYRELSPYSFTDTTQAAIKSLINLPLRLYTEPDIHWWLRDGVDYSLMNAFDFAALANELKRLGNTKLELITTDNKGYRNGGKQRHPHSWSIAEPVDLVAWLKKQQAK
ncbi:MAG: alpha/beta hydrolase [Bacteroidota bacterium]